MTRLTTTVIGAGPAGLLFCAVGRLLHAKRGGDPAAWTIRLVDKRDGYARTHRLRMDPAPYRAIQREVEDPRFDALMAFLDETEFTPEVNVLEARLLELVESLGVKRELLVVGETPLAALRPEGPWTVVAADSVRSTVRELVCGEVAPARFTHQRVARLRVLGGDLARALGVVEKYRLSKVLGSLLDYRLNRNGFAEVDLFLTEREHEAIKALGATPKEPVPISAAMLSRARAPLFRRVVEQLERGEGRQVLLHSTFTLEHTVMPRVVFEPPGLGARVFLLGDAAVSLPFFRGMACLARCALALARVHVEGVVDAERYEREVAAIVRDELAVVAARARLVRGLREFARLSALLPFPLQSWWLSAPETERAPDRATFGFFLNVALALAALALVAGGLFFFALPVELAGGFAYHAALELEAGPHRLVRRVWQLQIAAIFALGVAVTARSGELSLAPFWWFLLAVPFVVGLYLLEALGGRWQARAEL
jgi:hypothetical protein